MGAPAARRFGHPRYTHQEADGSKRPPEGANASEPKPQQSTEVPSSLPQRPKAGKAGRPPLVPPLGASV